MLLILGMRADGLRYLALRVTDKIVDHIGIEQIAHQILTGSSASSEIGGKSSSSGDSVANTASRDLGGAGSMISRLPSLQHNRVFSRKLKFARNPNRLASPVLEQLDVSFRAHRGPVAPAPPNEAALFFRRIAKLLADDLLHFRDFLNPADGQFEGLSFMREPRRVLSM